MDSQGTDGGGLSLICLSNGDECSSALCIWPTSFIYFLFGPYRHLSCNYSSNVLLGIFIQLWVLFALRIWPHQTAEKYAHFLLKETPVLDSGESCLRGDYLCKKIYISFTMATWLTIDWAKTRIHVLLLCSHASFSCVRQISNEHLLWTKFCAMFCCTKTALAS